MIKFNYHSIIEIIVLGLLLASCQNRRVILDSFGDHSSKTEYALAQLQKELVQQKFETDTVKRHDGHSLICLCLQNNHVSQSSLDSVIWKIPSKMQPESFYLYRRADTILVYGADSNGLLYGCQELAEQIRSHNGIPNHLSVLDGPKMKIRGTCVGLQKSTYLPGRQVYEYPITPENFPWFYDKKMWKDYLDQLAEDRFNALFLWNGHPFASLVKVPDYPFAVEVPDSVFKMNRDMYAYITSEAGKRGIWVIQMFYNIIVSKPFADHYSIKTQDRKRPITPLIADYTRKSIACFIKDYPNVGLLVTLGEAMNTIDDDVQWFTKTIIPGVKDGLDSLGLKTEPPIVLRAHDTDASKVMAAALPVYHNLYTMFKYNGESLTTYQPHGTWVSIPKKLSQLGSLHIANVHILANLEPFRYGSPDFIERCVQAMEQSQGAKGLHLYPQASYWDWPYTADKTDPRTIEYKRDWIWYKAWGRYAWNCYRDSDEEANYWIRQLNDFFGSETVGKTLLSAYEADGEIAPKLLRNFGISDGNRQTLLLGMTMGQLVNPDKYTVYSNFREANGPLKEILKDYVKKELSHQTHKGEIPPSVISDVVKRGDWAVAILKNKENKISRNEDEFSRIVNDAQCYDLFAHFFADKVKAAMAVYRYGFTGNIADLDSVIPFLNKSVNAYRKLAARTDSTYLYANSMQTAQRRIPVSGADGKNVRWSELLPVYETELANFKRNLSRLKNNPNGAEIDYKSLHPLSSVTLLNKNAQWYSLKKGQKVFTDQNYKIAEISPELLQMRGVRFSESAQREEGTVLQFSSMDSVKVLVGYFNTNSYTVVPPPSLETNAHANDYGQADLKIANVMEILQLYPVNIYTYTMGAGKHQLDLGKGRILVLGFVSAKTQIPIHDAGLGQTDHFKSPDWLFY